MLKLKLVRDGLGQGEKSNFVIFIEFNQHISYLNGENECKQINLKYPSIKEIIPGYFI